ncbi:hypothetical protein GCM10010284_51260 [Streptomyces rubiginosohelvolus]|nr:hypothetical protein GCM10010284_51260 [Streptomyces rubiginosohelvolus]
MLSDTSKRWDAVARGMTPRATRQSVTTPAMNALQAAAGTTSAGPVGFLLSRTGTTPGNPSATCTQLPPSWLL